jgi:two-component system, NarL family, response regulator DevR
MIVEDHPLVRDGIVAALQGSTEIVCVGVAGTVAEAGPVAAQTRPDVVLLDYRLPDGSGADAATAIRAISPGTAFAVLTGETSHEVLLSVVEAGASAFVPKSADAARVIATVTRVAAGEMLIPAAVLSEALAERTRTIRADAERTRAAADFTGREREILQLMADGLDTKAIAASLVLSITTIRWHARNILEKLDAHSRLEAVARAGRLGLLLP